MSLARIPTKKDLDSFASSHGRIDGLDGYLADGERDVIFPYLEANGRKAWLAVGRAMRFVSGSKQHVVTFFYGEDDRGEKGFSFVCGDTFLGGSLKGGLRGATTRAKEAVAAAIAAGVVPSARRDAVTDEMMGFFNVYPGEAACGFYRTVSAAASKVAGCKHVAGVLHRLRDSSTLASLADDLERRYTALAMSAATAKSTKARPVETLAERLKKLLDPARPYKVPVLVEGPAGWGKTVAGRDLGLTGGFDTFVECNGHSGMEAFDFIGGYMRCGNDFFWLDGPVTRAYRLAAQGKKVLLFIDELLRVPRRERNVFLSALSPHRDVYRLPTGRAIRVVDGIAEQEMIEAPVANIAIVATTNIGAAYDVESDDPALAERFLRVFVGKDMEFARLVLLQMVGERAAADKEAWNVDVVPKVVKFMDNMAVLAKDNIATAEPSLRMVTRAVLMATSSSEVKDRLIDFVPTWVGRTLHGEPIPEQVKGVKAAITSAFAA